MPEAIDIAIAWAIVIGTIGTMATVFTAVRARIRASRMSQGVNPVELSDLRDAVQRLDGEVAELTERLDFAERLLAKPADRPPPPNR